MAAKTLDTAAILMVKLAPGRSKLYNLERYGKNNGPLGAVIGSKFYPVLLMRFLLPAILEFDPPCRYN